MQCTVGCNSDKQCKSVNSFRFFRFWSDIHLQTQWKHACKGADSFNINNGRICLKHFNTKQCCIISRYIHICQSKRITPGYQN